MYQVLQCAFVVTKGAVRVPSLWREKYDEAIQDLFAPIDEEAQAQVSVQSVPSSRRDVSA